MLAEACPRREFATARFELYQAKNFQSPMEEGISLYLYRTVVSTSRRNLPPRTMPDGRRLRPPLPIDLYFLLTPWASSAERQHDLLGWAMRVLEDGPVLPSSLLNHYCANPETFRSDETIELLNEPVSLQDMVNIWEVAKQNIQLSVAYLARQVAIESKLALTENPPAQTRVLEFGKGGGA